MTREISLQWTHVEAETEVAAVVVVLAIVVVVVVAMFSSQFASHRPSDTRKALAGDICGRGA